ncbi:hypothetical protein M8J76_013268 [Diaphorina citri]|nr:hypothetical protein M8J75_014149 [Diaphorina citri]KAI5719678.1 hypothetical protein M8J76_013268 [Diaphorina citri]KAI5720221.1 hypothetical protein M8J77_003584 [Diaphorina citri]
MAKSNTKDDRNDLPPPYTPQPLYPQQVPIGYGSLPPPPKYDATQAINTQPGYYGATYQFPVQQEIIIVGGCPICRIGKVEEYYSCLGLFCAVFCFPFGLIPCLLLKDKICTNCGTHLN